MSTTTDRAGRTRRPAGSPASSGGEFAPTETPAASAELQPQVVAPTTPQSQGLLDALSRIPLDDFGRIRYSPLPAAYRTSNEVWRRIHDAGLTAEGNAVLALIESTLRVRFNGVRPQQRRVYLDRRQAIRHAMIGLSFPDIVTDEEREALTSGVAGALRSR